MTGLCGVHGGVVAVEETTSSSHPVPAQASPAVIAAEKGSHRKSGNKREQNEGFSQCREIEVHVGEQLKRARLRLGMSQTTLGKALGVTHRQVSYYERAVSSLDAGKLYQAAEVLGVSVLYFYEGLVPQRTKDTDSS